MPTSEIALLNLMVRGAYDLQKLRIQCGLRLCANFRSKLGSNSEDEQTEEGELSEDAKKIIDQLKASYRRLTDGVARNRTLPDEKKFSGDALISTFTELVLVDQYIRTEKNESTHFTQLQSVLDKIPIYTEYLSHEQGIGPAMAGVLIAYLDPAKARHVSSFWRYAGLDVAEDGFARSRRAEHLIERQYIDCNGEAKTRQGVTFNPFLRTKILGVLSGSFLRTGSHWRKCYDDYKHRLETDPSREKVTSAEWKKRRAAGANVSKLWTPGRIQCGQAVHGQAIPSRAVGEVAHPGRATGNGALCRNYARTQTARSIGQKSQGTHYQLASRSEVEPHSRQASHRSRATHAKLASREPGETPEALASQRASVTQTTKASHKSGEIQSSTVSHTTEELHTRSARHGSREHQIRQARLPHST